MAIEESVVSITVEAGGNLSSDQYKFGTIASDAQVDLTASAGGEAHGVIYNAPSAAGEACQLAIAGRVKVTAGAAVAAGAKVQSDASGLGITAASGDHVLGTALSAASASGDVFEVLLGSHHILA
jgi:hypothetical protein